MESPNPKSKLQNPNSKLEIPPFLDGENPAQVRYQEATELFALFDYLKAQKFGVFSIRESLQAVGERRDGTLQGFHLSTDEAWESIRFMDSLGVGVVELPAFPANPYGQGMNRDLLAHTRLHRLAIEFAAHARCVEDDVRAACDSGFRRLHLYIGTSKIKQATARASVPQLAEKAFAAIALARELGATCVRISTEDAFRTTLEDYEVFYVRLQGLLAEHAQEVDGVGIPDTVGISTMDELGDRIAVLRQVGLRFSFLECHVHNDIGNADRVYVDTLLLCQRLGIVMLPDFSILGIGERNGTIGLSSLLEAIYRRLILLYPRKMTAIRQAMRQKLGTLPPLDRAPEPSSFGAASVGKLTNAGGQEGELFVNRYRDADAFFYRILARLGFIFDRSPFSANTEFDGSGVHADTTLRAYRLALSSQVSGQEAIDLGNSAYCGALPPYDMPLRTPVLACFGCGKANVRYWREHEGLRLLPPGQTNARLQDLEDAPGHHAADLEDEAAVDELVAQLIRCYSIKYNGITHQEAMDIVRMFYA
jgi:hypothetical protein